MTTRAARTVVAATVLAVAAGVLTGCTETADESRTVQSHLGRIDHVDRVQVTTPSWEHGAAFAIGYDDIGDADGLATLLAEVDEVAADRGFTPYRVTLTPSGDADHELTVDDAFSGSDHERGVLDAWTAVGDAMIGRLDYTVEGGAETIAVDSGGGITHDVDEARRLGYGGPTTRWTFRNGATSFVVAGAVTSADVALLADVQGDVGSPDLPATASGWRLGRYADHVRLDVDLDLEGAATSPAGVTPQDFGDRIRPLAGAALDALARTGHPRFLSLRQVDADGSADVLATWTSTQPPTPGRDRLDRGWDGWLARLADS